MRQEKKLSYSLSIVQWINFSIQPLILTSCISLIMCSHWLSSLSRFTSGIFPTKKWWDWASWQGNRVRTHTHTHMHCTLQLPLCLYVSRVSVSWLCSSVIPVHWPGGLEPKHTGYHLGLSSDTSLNSARSRAMRKSFWTCGNPRLLSQPLCLSPSPPVLKYLFKSEYSDAELQ